MSYEPTTWATGDIITATKLNNIESGVQSVNNSYTPTTWVTGDIITAEKLNNIEQGIANASGGSWVTLTEESVTVDGMGGTLTYNTQITADTIKVTLNGTEYTVSPTVDTSPFGTSYTYGAPWSDELDRYDYSTYPFSVASTSNGINTLHTESAGTYSIKIEAPQSGGSSES